MGQAGGVGEGAGHQQQLRPRLAKLAVQLGETQVVAHAQSHAPGLTIARAQVKPSRGVAGLEHTRFIVALLAIVKTKQMHLVVARHTLAHRVVDQATVAHLLGLAAHRQGQGAPHHPQSEFARSLRQHALDGTVAKALLDGQFVGVTLAQQAKILGQHGQLGALLCGLVQCLAGLGQIGIALSARNHLDCGHLHGLPVLGALVSLSEAL